MNIAIIGAGVLGLTAAYELVKKGHNATIFEKEKEVGGLVVDFEFDGWHLEKFYHHLFKTDKEIISLIKEIGLDEKLVWNSPETSVFYNGHIYPLDSALDILIFSPLTKIERLKLGFWMLYLKLQPNHQIFQNQTAVFWLKKHLGDKTFKVLWEPLLKAKFGLNYDKIAMSWFWARIHYRTRALGYLKGGFYHFYNRLREILEQGGTKFEFEAKIEEILSVRGKPIIKNKGKRSSFDKVVATIPTAIFTKLAKQLPKNYIEKYPAPQYYGAQTVVLLSDRQILPVYWLSICDPSLPFLAYVEHTNFMDLGDYGGGHLVYLGNYYSHTDPNFLREERVVVNDYIKALTKLNKEFEPLWIKKSWVFRTPYAQPIVDVDYEKNIPPFETPLKNVYLANMAQVYPQDRGQNYSVALAKKVVKLIGGE